MKQALRCIQHEEELAARQIQSAIAGQPPRLDENLRRHVFKFMPVDLPLGQPPDFIVTVEAITKADDDSMDISVGAACSLELSISGGKLKSIQ